MVKMEHGKDTVTSSFDYLIDSDVFVGMFLPNDSLFRHVQRVFHDLKINEKRTATTNWVIAETATVLSNKDSQQTAIKFLSMIDEGDIPILPVTEDLESDTHRIFREQTTKRTSMVDCSNVAVALHYSIPDLLAFDQFYTRFGYQVQKVMLPE